MRSKRTGAALAGLVLAGCVAAVSASHEWASYHWPCESCGDGGTVFLDIGDNYPGGWSSHFTTAIGDWNVSSKLDLSLVSGGTSAKRCRPTSGRVEACAASYGNNGWLGIAQIWLSGDHISQALVKINETYFNGPPYNTSEWRQFVVCQEVGHTFGLDHQDEDFDNPNLGTCMDYTSTPSTNQHPNGHDYAILEAIYAHSDVVQPPPGKKGNGKGRGAGPALPPPAMGQIDFDTPGQWGRLVSSTRNGRGQTYELDFGGGFRVLTHVLWADPDADSQ